MYNLEWADFKSIIDSKSLKVQYFIINNQYKIHAFDGQLSFFSELPKKSPTIVGSDQEDFELNYLSTSNTKLVDRDTGGRQVTRNAASNKGTSYRAHFFEFESSKLTSLVCKNWEGTSDPALSIKFYDASNVELTTQATIDTDCVKTIVTFKPGYDYELISGSTNIITTPSEDLYLFVIGGVPELGAAGVKEFVRQLNIKYLDPSETLKTDGRASKFMKKDTIGIPYQTNQLQVIMKHTTPGFKHKIMMSFEYFRV